MMIMRFIPTFFIAWLVFGFVSEAQAFACASGATVGARLTVTVLNSAVPCAAGSWVVFSPVEQTAIASAVAANVPTAGTVFDPVLAGSIWMFAITMILGVWLLAKNAGIIIDMVKRW